MSAYPYQGTLRISTEERSLIYMNELLEKAFAAVRALPQDDQEDIARLMLELVGNDRTLEDIDPAHLPDILESLADARDGRFATEAEITAALRRFG